MSPAVTFEVDISVLVDDKVLKAGSLDHPFRHF
jgi:hypothetical protein